MQAEQAEKRAQMLAAIQVGNQQWTRKIPGHFAGKYGKLIYKLGFQLTSHDLTIIFRGFGHEEYGDLAGK